MLWSEDTTIISGTSDVLRLVRSVFGKYVAKAWPKFRQTDCSSKLDCEDV